MWANTKWPIIWGTENKGPIYLVFVYVCMYVYRQSIKKPNFWNSEPASMRNTLAMVALCSGDFKLYSDASSITPCQLVIELDALEWVCLVPSAIFLHVEKWRILRSNAFASNSVSNWGKKLLRRLFGCSNRLMERIVWAVRNVTSGTSVCMYVCIYPVKMSVFTPRMYVEGTGVQPHSSVPSRY